MSQTREQIKADITATIKQNGKRGITGLKLQDVLVNMADNLAVDEDLKSNYVDTDTIDQFLLILGEYMNGIWTRTFDGTTGKHIFKFTPNPGFFYPDYILNEN